MTQLFGGIEAGGTKTVCAIGRTSQDIYARLEYPTTTPWETIRCALDFFEKHEKKIGKITSLGIASFGPLDLKPDSPKYGSITGTPKPGWSNTDWVSPIKKAMHIPIVIDTDVNAACLAEWFWGEGRGLDTVVYLTIGTGIGGGGIINGQMMHGLLHPEMGHMLVPHDWHLDPFSGICSFHGDCLEGMASGTALTARWRLAGESLPVNHPAWDLEAHYLALGLVNIICLLAPQRIIMGGGVMRQTQLFQMVRSRTSQFLKNYIEVPGLQDGMEQYIVPPLLGEQAGIMGALALAGMNRIDKCMTHSVEN